MGDKGRLNIPEILSKNWRLAAAGGVTLVAVSGLLFLSHGRIKNPRFCTLCHEIQYDYKEYAVNKTYGKVPRGVLVGCPECHTYPFVEYKKSEHYTTEEEPKPGCANCHTPHRVGVFAGFMYLAVPPWQEAMESLTKDMEKWEKDVRPMMAKKAREMFQKDGSRSCKECHIGAGAGFDDGLEAHIIGSREKMTCVECHFNLVHKEVPWPEMEEKKESLGID